MCPQKGTILQFIIFCTFCSWSSGHRQTTCHKKKVPQKTDRQHYLIEFKKVPQNSQEHSRWVNAIEEALDRTEQLLTEQKLIAPHRYQQAESYGTSNLLQKIRQRASRYFYDAFFHTHSLTYPHKRNYPFFTRRNEEFGSIGVYSPDGVNPHLFLEMLKEQIEKRGVKVQLIPDTPLYAEHSFPESFSYITFTDSALKLLAENDLEPLYQDELRSLYSIKNMRSLTNAEREQEEKLTKALELLRAVKPQLFWQHTIPTTGLKKNELGGKEAWKANYPFLPHRFPLWKMAPKRGRGITVALIDTGIAAFQPKINDRACKFLKAIRQHPTLTAQMDFSTMSYNLVHKCGLNPLEEGISLISRKLDPVRCGGKKFTSLELETRLIHLIHSYLQKRSIKPLQEFFKCYGVEGLFKQENRNELSNEGMRLCLSLEQELQQFHLVEIINQETGITSKALLELMPIASADANKELNIERAHGSHVAGTIAGRTDTLANDYADKTLLCGIAPEANIIMIKAFSDRARSHQSVLISALVRALESGAQIINMSLKSADFINRATEYSRTLETLLKLVPYCVAAAGNDGDPTQTGHPGKGIEIEAYPARLESIPFDIGAFGYDDITKTCPVSPLSQFERKQGDCIGPKFLAPGHNILSCGLVDTETNEPTAIMMHGTSTAAPMISGFVALMLSEFGQEKEFTREQLLKVCYRSGINMMADQEWKKRSIFGALDMRTALFILHVLRAFKNHSQTAATLLAQRFDQLLEMTHFILFAMPNEYSLSHLDGTQLQENFCRFYHLLQEEEAKGIRADLSAKEFNDFGAAVSFITESLLYATDQSTQPTTKPGKKYENVLKKIFTNTGINIFDTLAQTAQKKVRAAITQKPVDTANMVQKLKEEYIRQPLRDFSLSHEYWSKRTALLGGL